MQQVKVEAIARIPCPMDVNRVRTFMGLVNYYRRYVRIDESNNLCGLVLTMVTISIQMMKSPPIYIRNFDRKMVGQIILKFTYIKLNAD